MVHSTGCTPVLASSRQCDFRILFNRPIFPEITPGQARSCMSSKEESSTTAGKKYFNRPDFPFSAFTLLVGQQEGHSACKMNWVLVCWWWQFDWSLARLIVQLSTTTSIILSSNKIQNGDILVLVNPGPPGKWPLKWRDRCSFCPELLYRRCALANNEMSSVD